MDETPLPVDDDGRFPGENAACATVGDALHWLVVYSTFLETFEKALRQSAGVDLVRGVGGAPRAPSYSTRMADRCRDRLAEWTERLEGAKGRTTHEDLADTR